MARKVDNQKRNNIEQAQASSFLTDYDIHLINEGTHFKLYEKLGSHKMVRDGVQGYYFGVCAPNAESVSVIGHFNNWDKQRNPLSVRWDSSGIWEGFIPGLSNGSLYKYYIVSKLNNYTVEKRDPFANFSEIPPQTASIIWSLEYILYYKSNKKKGRRCIIHNNWYGSYVFVDIT